jgi:hypothetical protein
MPFCGTIVTISVCSFLANTGCLRAFDRKVCTASSSGETRQNISAVKCQKKEILGLPQRLQHSALSPLVAWRNAYVTSSIRAQWNWNDFGFSCMLSVELLPPTWLHKATKQNWTTTAMETYKHRRWNGLVVWYFVTVPLESEPWLIIKVSCLCVCLSLSIHLLLTKSHVPLAPLNVLYIAMER